MKENYVVKQIEAKSIHWMLLNIHYAKRVPPISFCYGLFLNNQLVGCVCYGKPVSSTLRNHLAGLDEAPNVYELNRLVLINNLKNEASMLVARSLKLLPKNLFIVSFADKEQDHKGIVYQAANFKYFGLSAKRTDWALHSRPELHGQTISDMARGQKSRVNWLKDKFGDDFYLKPRSRKHRYVYVTGKNKELYAKIKYSEEEYPK